MYRDMTIKRRMAQENRSSVYHQEEPSEQMSKETSKCMKAMQEYVLKNVLLPTFDERARIPQRWAETSYGRVKFENDYTAPHRDYVNTIIERNLLAKVDNLTYPSNLIQWKMKGKEVLAGRRGNDTNCSMNVDGNKVHLKSDGTKSKEKESYVKLTDDRILSSILKNPESKPIDAYVPIYTVWIALHSLDTFNTSHLRIHPSSHAIHDLEIIRHKGNNKIIGMDSKFYKTNKDAFLSPASPYEIGDIVIFHCLTRHDANSHINNKDDVSNNETRVSFDMRVLMDGMSKDYFPLMFCV